MPKRKRIRRRSWRKPEQLSPGLRLAVEAAGGSMSQLAVKIGVSPQAIAQWNNKIPAARILDIERVTKVAREDLRPDLYRRRQV